MSLAYNDGGIKFVQQTISALDIAAVSTTYIVKKGSLEADSNRIVSNDEFNNEKKQAFNSKIRTGSLTLQFVNAADKEPKRFQVITVLDTSGANVNVIIHKVKQDFGAAEEAMLECTIAEQMAVTPEAG